MKQNSSTKAGLIIFTAVVHVLTNAIILNLKPTGRRPVSIRYKYRN